MSAPAVPRPATTAPVRRRRRAFSARAFPGTAAVSFVALAFLYVPMAVVVVLAFNTGDRALIWEGFGTQWFGRVLSNADLVDATLVSLRLAALATLLATVMAVGIALVLDRWGRRGAGIALALIGAPLIIPEVVLGVATLGFIRLWGLAPGFPALLLAHTTFCIPFALLPIRARLSQLDPAYAEAAADLGASSWRMLRRILLPLLLPGIVSGALLSFIISLDDVIISSFLSAAGSTTLPIYLFGLVRKGVSPGVNAVATLLLLLSGVVVTVTYLLTRKRTAT